MSWFWQNYVGPNIAKGTFVLDELEAMGEKTHNVTSDVDFFFSATVNKPISIKLKQKRLPKEENTIQIKQKKAVMAVYLCRICKTQLESVPKCYDEESIGCDKCPLWFHLKCVGISATSIPSSKSKWYCTQCQ